MSVADKLTERLGPCVLIPIPLGEKGPKRPGWQKLTTADMTEAHMAGLENKNVGVLLGSPSGGLVSIDCDSDEFLESILTANPTFRESLISTGSRGGNVWLRMAGAFPKTGKIKTADGDPWGEWRSDGSQTVIHGRHPSGAMYRINEHRPLAVDFDSIVWPSGLRLPWAQTENQNSNPPRTAGSSEAVDRARAHVAAMPAGISGQCGHDATFAVAKALMHDFALDEASAFQILSEFNQRCAPPWSEAELRHKLQDAANCTRTQTPRGVLSAAEDITSEFVKSLNSYAAPPPTLPDDALYGVAGQIVETIKPHTESHPAAILLQLLGGFGNIVGPGPHLMAEQDRHRANLFVLVVGDSSRGRKGSSWGHVRNLLSQVDPGWADGNVITGLSSGQGVINHLKDEPGESERTAPKDKRLQVLETEFGSVLKQMHREGNILSAVLRNAWDTGDLRNLTKDSPLKATGCHISLIGHITRVELSRLMSDDDAGNGFANRFLWVHSSRTQLLPDGGSLDPAALTPFIKALSQAKLIAQSRGFIKKTPEASEYWRHIYPKLTTDAGGMTGLATSRAEAQVLRLSLLFCLIEAGEEISIDHLRAAEAVWNYCRDSARWAFNESEYSRDASKLLTSLAGGAMTFSEIHQKIFSNNASGDRIGSVIKELAERVIVQKSSGRDGRNTKFVRLRE